MCMCAHTYVCYICMCICTLKCMYVSVCTYVYTCTGACFSVCRCVSNVSYGHVCTCLYARVFACACVCMCVNTQGKVGKALGIKDHSAGFDLITHQTCLYVCSGPAQTCLVLGCVDGSGRGSLITIFFYQKTQGACCCLGGRGGCY